MLSLSTTKEVKGLGRSCAIGLIAGKPQLLVQLGQPAAPCYGMEVPGKNFLKQTESSAVDSN